LEFTSARLSQAKADKKGPAYWLQIAKPSIGRPSSHGATNVTAGTTLSQQSSQAMPSVAFV